MTTTTIINEPLRNLNDMSDEEAFEAARYMAAKADIELVDMLIVHGETTSAIMYVNEHDEDKRIELEFKATGYFHGLNDIDGKDYSEEELKDMSEYGCPTFLLYDIDKETINIGKEIATSEDAESYVWMNGGVL